MEGFGWAPPPHCFGSFEWVPGHGGSVPPGAVPAGMDADGGHIFVGRAFHAGDLLPAKVCPRHGCSFVCWGGDEIAEHRYEVLVSDHVAWKYTRGGDVPPEAIAVGQTRDGERLYVGRTMYEGTMTPGKVHPSHGCLYIPFAGSEVKIHEYEIMVLN